MSHFFPRLFSSLDVQLHQWVTKLLVNLFWGEIIPFLFVFARMTISFPYVYYYFYIVIILSNILHFELKHFHAAVLQAFAGLVWLFKAHDHHLYYFKPQIYPCETLIPVSANLAFSSHMQTSIMLRDNGMVIFRSCSKLLVVWKYSSHELNQSAQIPMVLCVMPQAGLDEAMWCSSDAVRTASPSYRSSAFHFVYSPAEGLSAELLQCNDVMCWAVGQSIIMLIYQMTNKSHKTNQYQNNILGFNISGLHLHLFLKHFTFVNLYIASYRYK